LEHRQFGDAEVTPGLLGEQFADLGMSGHRSPATMRSVANDLFGPGIGQSIRE
jgi:hypothetical protein